MKTLIGIVTFGGLNFTKLAIKAVRENTIKPVDIFIVVGKPDDKETINYCWENDIPHKIHSANMGFPYSVNDIYDYGWVHNDYDNIIIMGNDVLPYPNSIDSMIELAETSEYELICASEFDVRNLCDVYEEAKKYFSGEDYIFSKFDEEPWKLFTDYNRPLEISDPSIANVQNLCLYKRSVFEKIGYTDVNFYPAYYIDNDYARRAVNAQLKSCTLTNAIYFHFWSRTIKQGTGGSNSKFFAANQKFYKKKWHGDFGQEQWTIPFNGSNHRLTTGLYLPGSLKIDSREDEERIINYWAAK